MTSNKNNPQDLEKIIKDIMRQNDFRHHYEVAEYFDVSAQTLSGWIKQNKIPPKHLLKYFSDFKPGESPDVDNGSQPHRSSEEKENFPHSTEKISIKKTYQLLKNNSKTVIGFPLIVSIITLLYLFLIAKPIYKTSAVILPTEGNSQNLSGLLGAATQMGLSMPLSMGDGVAWDEIYPEIVSSERLKRIVLKDTFSTHEYGKNQTLQMIISHELGILEKPDYKQSEEASKYLDEMIRVSKTRFSAIVTLDIFGIEPEFTANLARRIIHHSGKLQREYKTNQIHQKRQFLEDRISAVEDGVAHAEDTLKLFREQNRHFNKSPSLILIEERLNQELVLQRSLLLTLKTQYEKAKIEEVEKAAMIQVIDEPFIPWEHDSPKRGMVLIIATLLGFMSAIIFIYSKEYLFEMD